MQHLTNTLFISCQSFDGEIEGTEPEYFLVDHMDADLVTGKAKIIAYCSFYHQQHSKEITELFAFHCPAKKRHGFCCIYEYTVT